MKEDREDNVLTTKGKIIQANNIIIVQMIVTITEQQIYNLEGKIYILTETDPSYLNEKEDYLFLMVNSTTVLQHYETII